MRNGDLSGQALEMTNDEIRIDERNPNDEARMLGAYVVAIRHSCFVIL